MKPFIEYQRNPLCFIVGIIIAILAVLLLSNMARADELSKQDCIKAIMGEASNQGYNGMLAVACAIQNRGTLKGVYGVKAKHIYKEPKWVWQQAEKAYNESLIYDITNGATNWENIKAFGTPYWVKSMILVYEHKDHKFYKEK